MQIRLLYICELKERLDKKLSDLVIVKRMHSWRLESIHELEILSIYLILKITVTVANFNAIFYIIYINDNITPHHG